METFTKFLYEFLTQFFSGIVAIGKGFGEGFSQIFDVQSYQTILDKYKGDLAAPEWALVVIVIVIIIIFLALIVALIYLLIRKYLKFRKKAINQDELLDELASLNGQVASLMKEKEDILAMKVSQLRIET